MPGFRPGAFIRKSRLPYLLLSLFIIAGSLLAFPTAAQAATASDSFQRANGSLGANWTATADGGLSISGDQAVGQAINGNSGDLWTASTFGGDQFSQVTLTSTQLTGTQWLGAEVRGQTSNSGMSGYAGIYFANSGSPQLMLFKRVNGNWTQLGSSYATSPLAAGAVLGLSVAGSSLSLSVNGTVDLTATDTTLTGGAPGLMTNGSAHAAAWAGGDGAGSGAGTYTVGGSVSGLATGGTVTLKDNGGDTLSVSANGSFTFATPLAAGTAYSVTVATSPTGQTCTVAGGSGTVTANVTSVAVSCAATTYSIGGTVSGLASGGTVGLQDNGSDTLSVSANGSFTFPATLPSGSAYSVTVHANPAGQACTVAGGSGTVGTSNVTSVAVTCTNVTPSSPTASDSFQAANGSLSSNWTATADGGLSISGDQAVGQAISGDSGDLWTASTFTSDQFSQVTLTSTQLTGTQWIGPLVRGQTSNSGKSGYVGIYSWSNGSPQLMLFKRVNGNWTQLGSSYTTSPLAAGAVLGLRVVGSSLTLTVNGATVIIATDTTLTGGAPGLMTNGSAHAAAWAGGAVTYSIGGTVSGLMSGTLVLQDNGGDTLNVTANGAFTFPTQLVGGAAYSVTVASNPVGQSCTVGSGSGTTATANVTNVAVSCVPMTYPVGGTVSGLTSGNAVTLQDNGGDSRTVSANGAFTFDTPVAFGSPYAVTVSASPSNQSCTVASGSGTVGSVGVSGVVVTCTVLTYSVGGTVSGLTSGNAVTLQDNGGDTLAVGANGTFAFATKLIASTPYSVTVMSNPAGESCTVGGGAGTVGSSNVTSVTVSCLAGVADGFARANGSLGSGWTDMSDGGLAISSDAAAGTSSGNSGDIRTGETYNSDQFSSVVLTSTMPAGGGWIGPTVRSQSGGASDYIGFYFANYGSPELMLFKRVNDAWTQLGWTDPVGALPAGSVLELTAVGSALTLYLNGVSVINATDSSLSGGAPGIMASGSGAVTTWVGGNMDGTAPGTQTTGATTYSVSGTVAGLSGAGTAVTLQDNGGDNLSVTANGSFTFATKLISGAGYSVSVLSSPSGQACTVAGGAGTIGSANVTNVAVTCAASGGTPPTGTSASDNFQADANGGLSSSWTATSDGGLTISGGAAVGQSSGNAGDYWTASTFTSDQYSQVTLTSTQLTGTEWIGPMVRAQGSNSGQSGYVAIYFWNNGSPELMLFLRNNGGWSQLGSSHSVSALAAGTVLGLQVAGSTLTVTLNGATEITAADSTLTGGAPGLMTNGTAMAAAWAGGSGTSSTSGGGGTSGPAYSVGGTTSGLTGTVTLTDNSTDTLQVAANGSFTFGTQLAAASAYNVMVATNPSGQTCTVTNGSGTIGSADVTNVAVTCTTIAGVGALTATYVSTDSNGVATYNYASPIINDGTTEPIRVLQPTSPASGVPHRFLIALPVEPGEGTTYGDAISTLESLNAANQYNLTIVEPSFSIDPWYADSATDPQMQMETFMTDQLVPWIKANFATSGTEQVWLLGFSKSGLGAQDLILKHPSVYTLAASWDFPADMNSYDQLGTSPQAAYGTNANYLSNYQLSQAFVNQYAAPFTTAKRIWVGSYYYFEYGVNSFYAPELTNAGIQYDQEAPTQMAHRWDSGWVPLALTALAADATTLGG